MAFKIAPHKIKALEIEKMKCDNCGYEKTDFVRLRIASEEWNQLTRSKEIKNKTYKICPYCLNWLSNYAKEKGLVKKIDHEK